MAIVLLTLLDSRSWVTGLFLLNLAIQCAAGLIFVTSYLSMEMLLRCIEENEDVVLGKIVSLPMPEMLKKQLSEQMHCIARYYRNIVKR